MSTRIAPRTVLSVECLEGRVVPSTTTPDGPPALDASRLRWIDVDGDCDIDNDEMFLVLPGGKFERADGGANRWSDINGDGQRQANELPGNIRWIDRNCDGLHQGDEIFLLRRNGGLELVFPTGVTAGDPESWEINGYGPIYLWHPLPQNGGGLAVAQPRTQTEPWIPVAARDRAGLSRLGNPTPIPRRDPHKVLVVDTPVGKQVWVTPEYTGYREAWESVFGPAPQNFDVDHIYSRARAAQQGYGWVRLQAIPAGANQTAGRSWEKATVRLGKNGFVEPRGLPEVRVHLSLAASR